MKDKFKAMVERAIERGFKYKGANILCVDIVCNALKEIVYIGLNIDFNGSGDIKQRNWVKVSASDLLFNHEFMRALVGERGCIGISDKPCPITGYSTQREAIPFCAGKHCRWGESGSSRYIVGHINTILEAAQLPTDEQRIDYVHGLIKGESE